MADKCLSEKDRDHVTSLFTPIEGSFHVEGACPSKPSKAWPQAHDSMGKPAAPSHLPLPQLATDVRACSEQVHARLRHPFQLLQVQS